MTIDEALKLLELEPNFNEDALKKAYRQAQLVWHPDRFPGNDELKAKALAKAYAINEAFSTLSKTLESQSGSRDTAKSATSHSRSPDKTPNIAGISRQSWLKGMWGAIGLLILRVCTLRGCWGDSNYSYAVIFWDARINYGVFNDDIVLTNSSNVPITDIRLTITMPSVSKILSANRLDANHSFTWQNVISVPKSSTGSAILQCKENNYKLVSHPLK